ncbi:MAG: M20/M25/M40 family metallo-hydrolase [Chloracidobacterium sp.]|nr:M20/M25/M40 family metallo-hydrolase [Chloracidobacterium sp.]
MKRTNIRILFVLLLLASTAFGQTVKVAKVDPVETNLRKTIEYLASDKLEGRMTGQPGAVTAAGYVQNQFAKLRLKPGVMAQNGKRTYLQSYTFTIPTNPHGTPAGETPAAKPPIHGYNVVGILDGRDKVLRNEAIIIGAHFDHLGRGGKGSGSLNPDSSDIHHGADDNASGTAALIELARIFAKEKKNKRTIIFIGFSGEEEGLFGSKAYTANPVFPLDKTVAMINLDMVGRLSDAKLNIGGIGTATEWKRLVESMNVNPESIVPIALNPKVTFNPAAAGPHFNLALNEDGFGPSDHASFYMQKIPVLFFFTGTHLDYHKPTDTAEKINYAGEASIIRYVASIARSIDQNPQRPTYAVAKSANTGGRVGFSVSLGTIPSYGDSTDGMLVDAVRENTPASRAGVMAGDKIVMLGGKEIKNVYDYTAALGSLKPDVEVEIAVTRGGERLTLKITPVKRQ